MKYTVIIERSKTGFSAYIPDLPGCVAAGGTREETLELLSEAVPLHIELMRESGDVIPEPASTAVELEFAA